MAQLQIEEMSGKTRRLFYLSGAPRASTRPDAAVTGPRAHILGVIRGFEALGWDVQSFIVGDQTPKNWVVSSKSERTLTSSFINRLAADFVRLGLGVINNWKITRLYDDVDWSYERYGVFQALGRNLQKKNVPWIVETNGLYYVEAVKDRNTIALPGLAKQWEQWVYHQCDVLICSSLKLADLVVEELGVSREKIVIVPVAADTERLNLLHYTPIRIFTGPTIGFVGTLYKWQSLDVLIEAIADLRHEGMEYHLVVVGDGAFREEWQNLAHNLGLSNLVRFVGRMAYDEVPSYILGFDLGYSGQIPLQAGVMYGSPTKIYEYMALERPVVASTAYEDANQLIRNHETGYLFEAGNKEDLKRALRSAFCDQSRWITMGVEARREVILHHSWRSRIAEMIPQIEAILEAKYGTAYPAWR